MLLDNVKFGHDPGGSRRFPLPFGVTGDAIFTGPNNEYRPWLMRIWGIDKRPALWIGMNPSMAEADVDDPTIRKEVNFTKKLGLSEYIKCNIMDYRATDPKQLLDQNVIPRSPDNLLMIREWANIAHFIFIAWGVLPKPLRRYADDVLAALDGKELWCLGRTKDGSPRHPLYVPYSTELMRFR